MGPVSPWVWALWGPRAPLGPGPLLWTYPILSYVVFLALKRRDYKPHFTVLPTSVICPHGLSPQRKYGPATMRETPPIFEGTLPSLLDGSAGPQVPLRLSGGPGGRGGGPRGPMGPTGRHFSKKCNFLWGVHFLRRTHRNGLGAPRGPVGPLGPQGAPWAPWGPQGSASLYYRLS